MELGHEIFMGMQTLKSMIRFLIHTSELTLLSFACLYREAIRLQCFLPMHYAWPGVHMYVTTFTRFAKDHK